MLINLLRRTIKDEGVIQLIKKYLKSGVMEDGVCVRTEEGSPQGGPMSPLLANIYLNEFWYRVGIAKKVPRTLVLLESIAISRNFRKGYEEKTSDIQ